MSEMMFGSEAEMQIEEICDSLSLGEEVCLAVEKAESFKVDCGEVGKRVNRLAEMLRNVLRFIASAQTALYLRPVNSIVAKVKDNFKQAQDLVYNCKHQISFYRVPSACSNYFHFRNLLPLLDGSISDMQYLVSVYDPQSEAIDATGTASKKSAAFLVWSCIATVQMGRQLEDRVKAAERLALLAREKEYKEIIFEEGGVPPLQNLLQESSSLDAQIRVANALCLLSNEQERDGIIMKELISTIVNRLSRTSPIMDQIQAADLVASIAVRNPEVKEYHLIRENVIWRLVTLLSSEPSTDDQYRTNFCKLKISCSEALQMLAQESVSNCRTLTETKGMLCLTKLVKTEGGELQYNCLMIIREITAIAESNNDFRRSAFKSSPAAKAVVDGLLRVIKEFDEAKLRIPAIQSIGSLARCFSAEECRVMSSLVALLDNMDQEIAKEAAIALQKFVCTDNHLRWEHSMSIIEFNSVPMLMKLLGTGDKLSQRHGLVLICYLAKHGSNSNVLIEAGALTALVTTGHLVAAEHPELRQLVSDAISKLQSNDTDDFKRISLHRELIVYPYPRTAVPLFSKLLTYTDIHIRLSITFEVLPAQLPNLSGRAYIIYLMYGTTMWTIKCTIRKMGHKEYVLSCGWKDLALRNNFCVGDKLTLYLVQGEAGPSHYMVEVEKPARPSGGLFPRSFSLSHEVDDTIGTSRTKASNFLNKQQQLLKADVPIKQEEAITELADVAADGPVTFSDHVIAKPASRIFGSDVRADQATSKAHFKTEEESKMKFFGITESICMGEPPEINFFALAEDASQAIGDACYKGHTERLNLDSILGLPTPNEGEVNLDLTLAPCWFIRDNSKRQDEERKNNEEKKGNSIVKDES